MHSHGLRKFIDKKSVGNCESNCCKLIIKIFLADLLQLDEIDKFFATC